MTVSADEEEADDLPVYPEVYTTGALARTLSMANATAVASWKEQWAAAHVPGYAEAPPLAKYTVDGRNTYWISNSDSAYQAVIFDMYKWVHVKYPWDAAIIVLTRKSHVDFLKMYHEDEDNIRDYPYLMNRVEKSRALTDKVELQETLRLYTIPGRGGGELLQTPTHVIRTAEQCQTFLDEHWVKRDRTWVHKLASESQGNGIAFFPPESDKLPCDVENKDLGDGLVMQSHIDYPFTLSGKKSEIRAYWLLVSIEPLIVLLFPTGTTRLATNDYIPPSKSTLSDWDNPLVHILNTRQQKNANPDYHLTSAERKRAWQAIPQELRAQGRLPEGMTDDQWIKQALLPVVNNTVYHTVRAVQPLLNEANPLGDANRRWELFGLDIIFEDVAWRDRAGAHNNLGDGGGAIEPGGLKMWVTEVQVGPGLSLDCPTKIDVLPPMLS